MNRKLQAAWGLLTDVGGQALVSLATFLVTPLMLRMITTTEFGAWQTVLSLLTYMGLLDFGLGMALMRTLAALPSDANETEFSRTISSAFYSFCLVAPVFLAIGWWLSGIAPIWFGVTGSNLPPVIRAYRWATVGGALSLPAMTYGSILAGRQRLALANSARTAGILIGMCLCVVLLLAGFGVAGMAVANGAGVLAGAAISWYFVKKNYPSLQIHPSFIDKSALRRIWEFGGFFQIARIASTVAVGSDSLVIASRMNAAMVTPYNLTSKLPTMCSITLASKLPQALLPGLSSIFGEGDRERLEQILRMVLRISSRLACISAFLIGFCNERFVTLWIGHNAYGGPMLNSVFVYWAVQDTLLRGIAGFVYASGALQGWAGICIVEASINLFSSIVLAGPLGLVGVAMGTSIARTLTLFWLFWWCKRKIGIPFYRVFSAIVVPALLSVPGCLFGWGVGRLVPESLGWMWLVLVAGATVAGNLVCFEGWAFLRGNETNMVRRLMAALTSSLR